MKIKQNLKRVMFYFVIFSLTSLLRKFIYPNFVFEGSKSKKMNVHGTELKIDTQPEVVACKCYSISEALLFDSVPRTVAICSTKALAYLFKFII